MPFSSSPWIAEVRQRTGPGETPWATRTGVSTCRPATSLFACQPRVARLPASTSPPSRRIGSGSTAGISGCPFAPFSPSIAGSVALDASDATTPVCEGSFTGTGGVLCGTGAGVGGEAGTGAGGVAPGVCAGAVETGIRPRPRATSPSIAARIAPLFRRLRHPTSPRPIADHSFRTERPAWNETLGRLRRFFHRFTRGELGGPVCAVAGEWGGRIWAARGNDNPRGGIRGPESRIEVAKSGSTGCHRGAQGRGGSRGVRGCSRPAR
jgi:hypothetical protein